jgi:hypothetical protein
MTNRNLSQPQFGKDSGDSHNEVISGIEDMHGVGFTKSGLQYGDDGRIAPISRVSAHSQEDAEGPYHSMTFKVPTEDRGATNTMLLTNKGAASSSAAYGIPTGVLTMQYHEYPDSDKTIYRTDHHEDVPSAMEHLDRTTKERAEHLANKTVPPVASSRPGERADNGVWGAIPNSTGYESMPMVPPNIIQYFSPEGKSYKVDTGTRERIPKEDQ